MTFTGEVGGSITADTTLQEILQASASQIVMGRFIDGNSYIRSALGEIFMVPDMPNLANFIFWSLDGEVGTAVRLTLDESGTVTVGQWSWAIQDQS